MLPEAFKSTRSFRAEAGLKPRATGAPTLAARRLAIRAAVNYPEDA